MHKRNPLTITVAFVIATAVIIGLFYQKFSEPMPFFLAASGLLIISFTVLRFAAKFTS